MSDLLSGLGEIFGGFSAKRQIDEDGFDWREKRQAEQFERNRRVELARQQDEDRAVNQIADVLVTQDGDPDTSAIPQAVLGADAEWRVKQALGKLPERKSSIEAMKVNAQVARDQAKHRDRMEEIEVLESNRRARPLTQAEEARLQFLREESDRRSRQFYDAEAGRNRRFDSMPVPITTGEYDPYGNPIVQYQPRSAVPGMTAVRPNTAEYRARKEGELGRESMSTNLDTIQRQLDAVKQFSGTAAFTSPMDAYNARETYKASIQNLAIAANRVLGDTSGRYSDVDRQVAAAMLGVASDPILIANPEMAQARLDEARKSLDALGGVAARVRPLRPSGGQAPSPQPQGAPPSGGLPQPRSEAEFAALPSGTRFIAPDGSVRVKP